MASSISSFPAFVGDRDPAADFATRDIVHGFVIAGLADAERNYPAAAAVYLIAGLKRPNQA